MQHACHHHYFCVISLAFSGNKPKARLLSASSAVLLLPAKQFYSNVVAGGEKPGENGGGKMSVGWKWWAGNGGRSSVNIDFQSFSRRHLRAMSIKMRQIKELL